MEGQGERKTKAKERLQWVLEEISEIHSCSPWGPGVKVSFIGSELGVCWQGHTSSGGL